MPDDDEVGFGKPPRASQFRKGASGNPRGRPKGVLNKKTILKRALREKVVVRENGRRKRITKHEALYKQLVNKGIGGDLRATVEVIKLDSAQEPEGAGSPDSASESDQEVFEGILERMKQCKKDTE